MSEIRCPRLDFAFTGHCPNSNCLLWHKTEVEGQTGCLQLDNQVKDGLGFATARNNKLLVYLAGSEDPEVQLEASQAMLRFGLLFALNVTNYERDNRSLCKCGSLDTTCGKSTPCEQRKLWCDWLLKLFMPITTLNGHLTKRELCHVMLKSLLQHHKTHKLPSLLEAALPGLALSKRNI